jgi:competence protein ComEC
LTEFELIARSSERVPLLATSEQHLRERIVVRFGVHLAPLVTALLLGDRTQLPPALVDAFAASGALHLLAVSGLHVGFLAWLLAFGLGLVGWGPVRRASTATLVLVAYAMLVGGRPSVIRAATMTAALLWARAAERKVSVWQVWGLAAVAMLAWRPLDLFDLGFALSFGAVAGLLIWGSGVGRVLRARRPVGAWATVQRGVVASVVATGAAGLGTLPMQSSAFGWVAPAGFLVNPVAVPLAAVGLPLVWLALIADALGLGQVAGPLAATASLALSLLEGAIVGAASRFSVWVPGPGAWAIVLLAGLIVAAVLLLRHQPLAGWGVGVVIVALSLGGHRRPNNGLEVTWLDVGQGDAIVIRFPDGATWLVDAGPAYPNGDAGRSVVLPYLRSRGINRLRWLISTHPDLDHVGGAASVVDGVRVDRWGSPAALGDNPAYIRLLATVGSHPTTAAVQLRASNHLRQGAVKVDVLHPQDDWVPSDPYDSATTANDASLVLLISYAGCRVLLTGDIGERAETALTTALGDSLRAGLLHVGHHGSRHSTTMPWLARVKPTAAVVSVSALNRHGHPHVEVLERLDRADIDVYRTDRLGTVTARCVSGGWRVESATLYLR